MNAHAACSMCRRVVAADTRLPCPSVGNQSMTAKPGIKLEKQFLPSQPFRNCFDHAVRIHGASLRMMLFLIVDSTNDDSVASIGRNSNH
ncbi:hypothetical protein [Burkholderia lata]|uniref:hypothetical protein n=1 Tax=Burkholderia lata (strain ATCC 17760 / DSM 23089 / LMG 22485 / NCIMB 9086 / R18194 / 383) TaxID=482957 RepID=UPI001581DF40|nr:hypothetical protein [Burkholderia lata]